MPRIAASPLTTVAAVRYAGTPVAPVDPTPAIEVNERSAILDQEDSQFRYEDMIGAQEQRTRSERNGQRQQVRVETPRTSLFSGSAQSFADAFALVERGTTVVAVPNQPALAAVSSGIETYLHTEQVIHGTLPPRGENLSLLL